jgi:DNA polymerase-3 subunit epsilon
MILFFDTETTGFFKDHLPVDDPSQPYLVQLAAQLCDESGRVFAGFSLIVNPSSDGSPVGIPEAASNVHGITNEIAANIGAPLETVLSMFSHLYRRADLLCAHNVEFDKNIIEAAIARCWGKIRLLSLPLFCTMKAATPVINLPPTERMLAAGFDKPKPPKLTECIRHFFNEDLDDAHDAMADVVACRRVYFYLKKMETHSARSGQMV